MSFARRLLGWAFFLGFLWAVGFGVFHFVRYRPRFTIPDVLYIEHLSADGSRLVTIPWHDFGYYHERGPLQVWDTRRGQVVHEFFRDVKEAWFSMSPDGATVAAGLGDGTLWFVDWQSGQAWRVDDVDLGPLPQANEVEPCFISGFSSRGRWLFADHGTGKPTHFIDVARKKVLWRTMEKFIWGDRNERLVFGRNQENINVWDLAAGKCITSLPARIDGLIISPDGQTLLTRRVLPPPAKSYIVHGVDVWDLTTLTLRFQRELSPAGGVQSVFSPDCRTLAFWLRQHQAESDLALLDAATGRLLWSYRMKSANGGEFSADGKLWMLQHDVDLKSWIGKVTVFDVATGRVLWEKPGRSLRNMVGASGILHQEQDEVALLDAATGERRGMKLLDLSGIEDVAQKMSIHWARIAESPDGAYFAFRGQRTHHRKPFFFETWLTKWLPDVFGDDVSILVVVESATGRELSRLGNAGNHSFRTMLSTDASTLVTSDIFDEEHRMVRVWDVQPTRAWRWAVGMASATGLGLLALRWAWRWRKARMTMATQAASALN